jgi:acid phosphatase
MQSLCGYETVIRGSSRFCSTEIFSPDEWLGFEYANDIFYHYNTGYGNPVSGVIGFPWLNATLNLLASDQADQDLYVSFTHRELPPTVLVAMGLFNNSQFSGANDVNATMPTNQINYNRAWISSYILPFLTNIAIEKMNCSGAVVRKSSDSTFYRVLVNASPQSLPGCVDGPLESCSASGLQKYLSERAALFGGFSERCNVTYGNSTDTVSFYTSYDNGTMVGK